MTASTVDTPHRKRALENRESSRWPDTAARAKRVLEPAAMVTVVADRESDIHAEWATIPEDGLHVLTRAMVDRNLAGPTGGTLFAAAAAFSPAGKATIEIPARKPDRAKRTAPNGPRRWEYGSARWKSPDRTMKRTGRCLDPFDCVSPRCARSIHRMARTPFIGGC